MPETYETFRFDDKGVCNVCNNWDVKLHDINWDERIKRFEELVQGFRGKYDYDCIVPLAR